MSEDPTAAESPPSDEQSLREGQSRESAFEQSLVLCAEAIPHRVEPGALGWMIWVPTIDLARARASLAAWRSENRPPLEEPRRRWEGQTPAPIFAAICLAGQLATGPRDERLAWFARGSADAAAIVHGELWRCATALTLHADLAHALGNAVCGYVLLDALARRLGPAWAAWLALASGIAGNWLTAEAVRAQHVSIGASTAVFGALGALTAAQLVSREKRALLTIGAGASLLAFLGTGKESDLFAHLFGMLAGFLLGVGAGSLQREAPRERARQPLIALAALVPLAAAWWRALTVP
jgi:membrane associated rhomboid family serine protease